MTTGEAHAQSRLKKDSSVMALGVGMAYWGNYVLRYRDASKKQWEYRGNHVLRYRLNSGM